MNSRFSDSYRATLLPSLLCELSCNNDMLLHRVTVLPSRPCKCSRGTMTPITSYGDESNDVACVTREIRLKKFSTEIIKSVLF
jgi:hypothetical protein